VSLGLSLYQVVTPRGGYRINDQDLAYDERVIGFTSGVSYPIRSEFASQSLGFSLSTVAFKGDLPVGDRLDPYATRTILPAEGVVSIAHLGYSFSNAESSYDAGVPVRGVQLGAGLDYAGPSMGSSYTTYAFSTGLVTYLPMPWPGHHSLALRVGGAVSGGSYPRGSTYVVGGYDLENTSLLDTLLVGLYNSTFTLRGYEPRSFAGKAYFSQTLEYRFPILKPDIGPSTLPLYLRRIDGSLFLDYGGAFNHFLLDEVSLFEQGSLIYSPQLATAIGGELWINLALGYVGGSQLRFGYAYGFSQQAIPGGQLYFVASNSF
jgi:outer membrane protein assembly factor BamA